jgi:hypothetical protein
LEEISLPCEPAQAASRESLLPWRRAESVSDSLVLWMPCRFQDMPESQRVWLNSFLDRWCAVLSSKNGLTEECFMQLDVLQKEKKLSDEFYANLLKEQPLVGRSISSLQSQPKGLPTDAEIELLTKGKMKYDFHAMSEPRACWFRNGDASALRARYFGFGGMTILLMPRSQEDEKDEEELRRMISRIKLPAFMRNEPRLKMLVEGLNPQKPFEPPLFIQNHPAMAHLNAMGGIRKRNPQKQMQRVMFGLKTKEVFGSALKTDPAYAGIPFLLPRLSSAEVFHSTAEERASWFQLFDIYLRESPEDGGVLLVARPPFLPEILQVLTALRKDGYRYWEG